jgi:hypothetical protein
MHELINVSSQFWMGTAGNVTLGSKAALMQFIVLQICSGSLVSKIAWYPITDACFFKARFPHRPDS